MEVSGMKQVEITVRLTENEAKGIITAVHNTPNLVGYQHIQILASKLETQLQVFGLLS